MVKAEEIKQSVGKLLTGLLLATTIAVTPWMTIDPINLIKLVALTVGGFGIGALLLLNAKSVFSSQQRWTLILSALFIVQLMLVFLLSGVDKSFQFFGAMGRNTGLLCYFSLLFVLLGGMASSNSWLYNKIIRTAVTVGAASAIYGVFQYFDADPIGWANKYSPVIGFLGNPNFQSSFLGMSAIAALVILLDASAKTVRRLFSIFILLVSLIVIVVSNSQQGLLVFALGVGVLGFFKIRSLNHFALTSSYLAAFMVTGFLSVLGFLNKGFLSTYLYQPSVTYRGDYWRAGWKMALDNPLFGVGLDSYGDNYRKYRTIEATLRRGPDVVSNAAHNVFIDFAANGGFPLLAIYIGFLFLAGKKIWGYSKAGVRSLYFEGIVAVWIGYVAQSVISINQIGLAVWGWVLTGLIIGWTPIADSNAEKNSQIKNSSNKKNTQYTDPKNFIVLISGLIFGLILSLPPLISSSKEKSARATLQLEKILNAERNWPRDPSRSNQIAVILVSNKLEKAALKIAKFTTDQFPSNFDAWKVLSEIPSSTTSDKSLAKSQMKLLDPLNTNLK